MGGGPVCAWVSMLPGLQGAKHIHSSQLPGAGCHPASTLCVSCTGPHLISCSLGRGTAAPSSQQRQLQLAALSPQGPLLQGRVLVKRPAQGSQRERPLSAWSLLERPRREAALQPLKQEETGVIMNLEGKEKVQDVGTCVCRCVWCPGGHSRVCHLALRPREAGRSRTRRTSGNPGLWPS